MEKTTESKGENTESSNQNANEDYTRSFREASLVKDRLKNRTDQNVVIDYEGLTYVRYMKLFKPDSLSMMFEDFKGARFPPKGEVDLAKCINEPFHYRCYMPKNWITKIDNENFSHIRRVVIMFNGMNEDTGFDFYDALGEHFCNNNMAAILLPTPLHLNRRVDIKDENGQRKRLRLKPTDWAQEQPMLFYYSFLKSHNELHELMNKINPPKNESEEKIKDSFSQQWVDQIDKAFYKKHFWKHEVKPRNTEVIIFGYSLGGLRSLCYFMHNPGQFRCCITFNSGPNLFKAHSDELNISQESWTEMLFKLEQEVSNLNVPEAFEKHDVVNGTDKIMLLRNLFLTIYCGEITAKVKKILWDDTGDIFKRYLAITSGSDRIVDIDSLNHIAPENKHVHQLIVSGVDHNPATDQNWHEVLPRVENNIVNFIETCVDEHYKRQDIVDVMRTILSKTPTYKERVDEYIVKKKDDKKKDIDSFPTGFRDKEFLGLLKEISEADYSKEKIILYKHKDYVEYFLDLFYSSKGYYLNFSELYKKILRDEQRAEDRKRKKNENK